MMPPVLPIPHVSEQLHQLGVKLGDVLLVHCAFSQVKPIEDGPLGLIAALQTAVGPTGTLVMPSMTSDRDHVFDPQATACREMGVVADTFWRLPGVLRSNSPHAFAAQGPAAAQITADHPVDVPHGLDSPVGRAYALGGHVLLLGVDHTHNTTIHLAENLAGVRYRRQKVNTVLDRGMVTRVHYGEVDHCCANFVKVDGWLDARGVQRRGKIGYAEARLFAARDLVDIVVPRLRQDEFALLHPYGVDVQCDEARRSVDEAGSAGARSAT